MNRLFVVILSLLLATPLFANVLVLIQGASSVGAPTNSVSPVISGTPQVGSTLTASNGTWTNSPTGYTYQWEYYDTTTNISGATSSSYTPVTGDISHTLAVLVTATNGSGSSSPAASSPTASVTSGSSSTTLVALHTYYISPTGNDLSNGLTTGTAWKTPAHSVQCGDVIIAAAGNYTSAYSPFGTNNWGTVTSCPSTSGGIDGSGGIYFATLLCAGPDVMSCNVQNSNSSEPFRVDQSNWAVEGFYAQNPLAASCYSAVSTTTTTRHHVAFINDIGVGCQLAAFDTYSYQATASCGLLCGGVDQTAIVGTIAFNAASGSSVCGSGVSVIPFPGPDTSAGTHVFLGGIFSYNNVNGFCGARSNGAGGYTTAYAAATAGATSFQVTSTTNLSVGHPIGDLGNSAYNPGVSGNGAIPAGSVVNTITGSSSPYTITFKNATGGTGVIASPGIASGDNIAYGGTTDGEGIIFDSWGSNNGSGVGYPYQGVVEQSAVWNNGSSGFEIFCNGTCNSTVAVIVKGISSYNNNQDWKRQGPGSEFNPNSAPTGTTGSTTFINSLTYSTFSNTPGVVTNLSAPNGGTGAQIVSAQIGQTGYTVNSNWFDASATSCPIYATCTGAHYDLAVYNSALNKTGSAYSTGNTIGSAPFVSPSGMPTTQPDCTGYANVTTCMNSKYSVSSSITPVSGAAGLGYQPPSSCATDSYYPNWLKGVVYLKVSGSNIIEDVGLVNTPCGL